MSFTLRQLQYFVAVAEKGSVIGAAQTMAISQSAVTEAVKNLEADLGVALFERHARGLNITHSGHQFLRHATKILSDVSGARRAFNQAPGETGGRLNVGVTSLMAGYVMSDMLARYRRMNPGVEISAVDEQPVTEQNQPAAGVALPSDRMASARSFGTSCAPLCRLA